VLQNVYIYLPYNMAAGIASIDKNVNITYVTVMLSVARLACL